MDILTQKRVTNNGDGAGYFKHCMRILSLLSHML